MAGILNSKTRILDTILTLEGRRQLADGDFQVKYVSFTDGSSFYQASSSKGEADDASKRVYFEACHLPQDSITFESDDSGKLMPFPAGDLGVLGGKILSGSTDRYLTLVTGSQFASLTNTLLTSTLSNFTDMYTLGSIDMFATDNTFGVSQGTISFELADESPLTYKDIKSTSIDRVEAFYQDKRLAHLPTFQHLPPINRPFKEVPDLKVPIGNFPRLGQSEIMSYEDLAGDLVGRPSKTIIFDPTSADNTIFAQFFEQSATSLVKLDIIDFGSFLTEDDDFPEKRIFFAGKIFIDDQGSPTFINLFTLVFE
jgi:hypothetical protein